MLGNEENLANLFRNAVQVSPDHLAVVWEHGELTYLELEVLIRRIASALGPLDGGKVGILAHRTPIAYAAVQAILRQGGVYVPLNPAFPVARNAFILEKTGLNILVVGEECSTILEKLLAITPIRPQVVSPDPPIQLSEVIAKYSDVALNVCLAAGDDILLPAAHLAYVLFTSGSTGHPKGVMVNQANAISYVRNFLSLYPIDAEDRLSATFDLTFDLSIHDQFVCWAAGATLVVYPDWALRSPLEWTARHRVTVWFSVPSLVAFLEGARQIVAGALPALRLSLFAGEKLTWATSRIWRTIAPASRQVNLYGPTEATIAITHFEIEETFPVERGHHGGIPIGICFPGQVAQVRKENGTICSTGETGGLWLSGDQVADGYFGDEEKTMERFVSDGNGNRWYRTGDLVFEEGDGILQYVGREDFQVKVMGYRIELGEIEHALLDATGAAWALADVARFRGEQEEIFAVLPSHCGNTKKAQKAVLKERLPSYMIPRRFIFMDDVPMNANGKMDRTELRRRLEGVNS